MKKIICIIITAVVCVSFFTACGKKENSTENAQGVHNTVQSEDSGKEEAENTAEETLQNTPTPAPTATPTAVPTPAPDPTATPYPAYTVKLLGNVPVHSGPGKDHAFVQTIGENGTYTIVAEATDAEGKVWGKLKSGIGWVNISDKDTYTAEKSKLWVFFADESMLNGNCFERYNLEESEYMTNIAFRADNTIKNIRLAHLEYNGSGYTASEPVYKLAELPADNVLVLGVVFYGDTTTYGFEFTDVTNQVRHFAVSRSGKDGNLVFTEY